MTEKMIEVVTEYLQNNLNEALELAREMNSYDGSYEWTDAWEWDELCAIAAQGGADEVDNLVRAAVYGKTYGGMVRYDAYGNLEPAEHEDLIKDTDSYLIDIINGLTYYIDDDGYVRNITLSQDLQNILEELIEEDDEEDEE